MLNKRPGRPGRLGHRRPLGRWRPAAALVASTLVMFMVLPIIAQQGRCHRRAPDGAGWPARSELSIYRRGSRRRGLLSSRPAAVVPAGLPQFPLPASC